MQNFPSPGFTGALPDPVLNGYPLGNGYRWYLPALMRFNGADSFSPFGEGGVNPYAYCAADPINRSDPTGHINVEVASVVTKLVDDVVEREERDAAIAAAEAQRTVAQTTESGPSTSRGETGSSQDDNSRKRRASSSGEPPSPRRQRAGSSGSDSSGIGFDDRPTELHLNLNPLRPNSSLSILDRGQEIERALQDFRGQLADLEEAGGRIWRAPEHRGLRQRLPRTGLAPAEHLPPEVLTLNGNANMARARIQEFVTSLSAHQDVFSRQLAEAEDIRQRLLRIEMLSTGPHWRDAFTPN